MSDHWKKIMDEPDSELIFSEIHKGQYLRVWQEIEIRGEPVMIEEMVRVSDSGYDLALLKKGMFKRVERLIDFVDQNPDVNIRKEIACWDS